MMEEAVFCYFVAAFAVWRVSHMLIYENGPFHIFVKIRDIMGVEYDVNSNPFGTTWIAELFACVWCMSVWIGFIVGIAFLVFGIPWYKYILLSLSLSTIAVMIEEIFIVIRKR